MRHVNSIEYIDDNSCRVILDGYTVLELDTFTVSQSGIIEGEDAEDEVIEKIVFKSECIKAQKTALKYLNTKMRTEKQLLKYLKEKGIEDNVAVQTVSDMKMWGYIDDVAYSRAYIEYRLSSSKKSWRAIFYDLKAEGIESHIINATKEEYDTDEYSRALSIAENVLKGRSDEASLKRLHGVLARNGFYWDVINSVINSFADSDEY